MDREVYAKIIVDDNRAIAADKGTLDCLETEFARVNDSGFEENKTRIL